MDASQLKAINGSVVVVDDEKKDKTIGGIYIPEVAEQGRVLCGKVLSISPFLLENGTLKDPPIKVGDKVVYPMHAGAGSVWTDDGDRKVYRIIKWNEILAVSYEKSK